MKPIDLIRLQISLEYQFDAQGSLIPFHGSSEQAWYIVYRYAGGYLPYFNHLLPPELRQALLKLGPANAFDSSNEVKKLIKKMYQPCGRGEDLFWSGYFARPAKRREILDVTQDGETWVMKLEGQVVCQAVSIRQNERCAEVYVETAPEFRRRGFGSQVVAAWANQIQNRGKVGFYSYRMNNTPSAALARKLGVEWYADVVNFEAA